jgi:peptidoglycan/xylan/chitin deacetylase (PgdA/CDA1 family)
VAGAEEAPEVGSAKVLLYHGFGSRSPLQDPHHLFVPPQDLDRQLRFLVRRFTPLDLGAYLRGLARGSWTGRTFLFTMDDGYVSTLEVAAPLLARHRVPAVVFVCPGRLGGTSAWMPAMSGERLLDEEQVRELPRLGIEVGVHGMDHTILAGLDGGELRAQVAGARERLADVTGTVPRAFAYPEGVFDGPAVRAVREAGYQVGFSVFRGAGRYAVTRRPVTRRDSMVTFAAKLLPGYQQLERMSTGHRWLRRSVAWIVRQQPSSE